MSFSITELCSAANALYARTQRVSRVCHEAADLAETALSVTSTLRLLSSPAHAALVRERGQALTAFYETLQRASSFVEALPGGGS